MASFLVSNNGFQIEPSLTMTSSMEDLVSRMAKAWTNVPCNKRKTLTVASGNLSSCPNLSGHLHRNVSSNSKQSNIKLVSTPCFETAFLTADPVTRYVPQMISSSNDATTISIPHSLSSLNAGCQRQTYPLHKFVSVDNLSFKDPKPQTLKNNLNHLCISPCDLIVKESQVS